MSIKPKILSTQVVGHSRLFTLEALDLEFSNGEKRTFERCRGKLLNHGAVMVVPILNDETLVLIREYAAGVDRYELSFPKGLIDPGETVIAAANRELQEEAGFGAHDIQALKIISTSPSYMSGKMHLVLARNLYPQILPGDEPEPLEVIHWPLKDYASLLAREDFTGAMSISALFLALGVLTIV